MITINYGVFHLKSDNIYEDVIQHYKTYNVRPLALFSDAYVFSRFWDNLYILLLVILIMHVCNLFFIYKIAEKINIKLNGYCLTLFALAPILAEGLYWHSASNRIVVSLFFCLASIYFLLLYFEKREMKVETEEFKKEEKKLEMEDDFRIQEKKNYKEEKTKKSTFKEVIEKIKAERLRELIKKIKRQTNKIPAKAYLIFAIILNLLCVGYYEQTIALNLFLFVFVLICLKKYKYISIPIVSTTWIGAWYIYFMMNGEMQARGALSLSGILTNTADTLSEVMANLKNMRLRFEYSLQQGKLLLTDSWVSILLLIVIGALVFLHYKNNWGKDENKSIIKKILLGLIMFISPILPFFVLETSFVAVRNMYLPIFGLMIIVELIIDLILKIVRNDFVKNLIKSSLTGIAIVLFVISNINELNDYKKVHELDNKVVEQVLKEVGEDTIENKKSISVNFDQEALVKYKELTNYIYSVIEADWALAGKIQVTRQDEDFGPIYINEKQDEADYVLYFDEEMNLIKSGDEI